MNDHNAVRNTPHNVTSHGTQQGVTVHEAAAALGLSEEAVRARLRRGTLDGWKADDDTWRVRLPETGRESTFAQTNIESSSDRPGGMSSQSDMPHTPVTDVTPPLRDGTHHDAQRDVTDDALVTHLQDEVAYLRERLEDAMGQLAEERRRADVLRLGASVSTPDTPQDKTHRARIETSTAGIVARLRRLIAGNR